MSRIGVKELAKALQSQHAMKAEEAERFISILFDVINDGLHYEKSVKIKGLGTFKVTRVSARKSVDVNTGEPIEIAERDKINFTPEATLRDLVNRPFSQFETVMVNDGVDFSEIDKQAAEEEAETEEETTASDDAEELVTEAPSEPEKVADEEESEVDATAEKESASVEESSDNTEPQDVESTETEVQEASETESTVPQAAEEPSASEPESEIKPLVDFSADEDESDVETEQDKDNKKLAEDWKEKNIQSQNDTLVTANDLLRTNLSNTQRWLRILGIAVLALIVTCLVGGYRLLSELNEKENRIAYLEARFEQQKLHEKTAKQVPVAPPAVAEKVETPIKDKPAQTPKSQSAKVESKASVKTTAAAKPQAAKSQTAFKKQEPKPLTKYDSDPRVRTGAYNIIGVDQVVTVRKGQTLSSISKFYLGPGMECYVEAINGGITEIKEGQKIKIPKLKKKKK